MSEVVQLCAEPQFARDVLEHLFYHAWQRGASVLIGRPEPELMQALSEKRCLFYSSSRSWVLVHSRKPELISAFCQGEAFFTRLDGERCLYFQ
jgi:hypothetical protein